MLENLKFIEGDNPSPQILATDQFQVKVSISQFFGIEINDFAVSVAKTALWIAEEQMLDQTAELLFQPFDFLPLSSNSNIICTNALRTNWEDLLPAEECTYIIGNPPFLGHISRSTEQANELRGVWGISNIGRLDYVTGWYKKALDYLKDNNTAEWAFVSTNSITMGEPVPVLFRSVFSAGWKIKFAHTTFIWDSEASDGAHVHVVVIGFAREVKEPILYHYDNENNLISRTEAHLINGYLKDAPNVFIEQRRNVLSPMLNQVTMGNMPRGTGLIIEPEDYPEFQKDPIAMKYVRPFIMGRELIHNTERYCLWMEDLDFVDLDNSELLRNRVNSVRDFRLNSSAQSTRDMANTPHLFGQRAFVPTGTYLGIPKVFSKNRKYATCALLSPTVIPGDKIYVVDDSDGFQFSIISSIFFIVWQKAVGGRLKSDCSFSNTIVWNNLPVPEFRNKERQNIIDAGKAILDARAAHPGKSLAEFYDPDLMPQDLLCAHHALDAAVEEAYGVNFNGDEEKIVAHLFGLYEGLTSSN